MRAMPAAVAMIVAVLAGIVMVPTAAPEGRALSVPPAKGAARPPINPEAVTSASTSVAPVNCRKVKCVALTFDDGPVPQTASLLNVLKKYNAKATFFVLGSQAQSHRAILRRMAAEGHAIGNHSWSHPTFGKMSSGAIRSQLNRTQAVIVASAGVQPRLVRTPYGQMSPRIRKILVQFDAPMIFWTVDPLDWKYRNTTKVTNAVVRATRRNSIILLHDIHPTSRAAVPAIISRLQAKGYVFVTVPQLIGSHPTPGRMYVRG